MRLGAGVLGVVLLSGAAAAHIRLCDPTTLSPLIWSAPGSISVVIAKRGSSDLESDEHFPAVRNAIAAWNAAADSGLMLVENRNPAQQAREDYLSFDLHQVRFETDGSSGFFPPGSGIVAVTPVTFAVGGGIVDADVLFNDQEFRFTTRGEPSALDLQSVATHELGHFVGLDHTGVVGATMYPFVSSDMVLQRSLAQDDTNGVTEMAPTVITGSIRGRLLGQSDGTPVSGAHVSTTDGDGRQRSASITGADGAFTLTIVGGGFFTVHATPLGGPVRAENLSIEQQVELDFSAFVGPSVNLLVGDAVDLGDLVVPVQNGLELGAPGDPLPCHAIGGDTTGPFDLGGSGLVPGSTLESSDPSVAVSALSWQGNRVRFLLSAPDSAAAGHADLIATAPNGTQARLVGAVELTPEAPVVSGILPVSGSHDGGFPLTLTGSGFRSGARVVLGGNIYEVGVDAALVDPGTIELVAEPSSPGLHDVVVIDRTGPEGRLFSGFRFTSVPHLDSVFPRAGDAAGGTELLLLGTDFEPDVQVVIEGVLQSRTWINPGELLVSTKGGATTTTGLLEVVNPGGGRSTIGFSYVARADPELVSVAPSVALPGDRISIAGRGFSSDATVVFGADPRTGGGGVEGSDLVIAGATMLEVTLPAIASGEVTVMVRDGATEQAAVLVGAFTVQAVPGRSGGGGCHTAVLPGSPRPVDLAAWVILLLVLTGVRGRQARARLRPA